MSSEVQALKDFAERATAQIQAFDQTVKEILNANINLKTNISLLENQNTQLTVRLAEKHKEIEALTKAIEKCNEESADIAA